MFIYKSNPVFGLAGSLRGATAKAVPGKLQQAFATSTSPMSQTKLLRAEERACRPSKNEAFWMVDVLSIAVSYMWLLTGHIKSYCVDLAQDLKIRKDPIHVSPQCCLQKPSYDILSGWRCCSHMC